MATVNIYLTFDGTSEEAFRFYQSVLGGVFTHLTRFKEIPQDENSEPLSEEDSNKIMHITLPISDETCLMGSDSAGEWTSNLVRGNNFSISINADSVTEANELFDGLSAHGKVTMPMDETFWGAYFGMFTDKFGINWMVNHDLEGALEK